MKPLTLPAQALILVGDGRKALFLRNLGTATEPRLGVETSFAQENPATRDQGSDRPGRTFTPTGGRAGFGNSDWHEFAETEFAETVAETVTNLVRGQDIRHLVVVAPPRTLAVLRDAWPNDISQRIIAELPKDLTRHPLPDILQHLID